LDKTLSILLIDFLVLILLLTVIATTAFDAVVMALPLLKFI